MTFKERFDEWLDNNDDNLTMTIICLLGLAVAIAFLPYIIFMLVAFKIYGLMKG